MKRAAIAVVLALVAGIFGTRLGAQHASMRVERLRERKLTELTRPQARAVCEAADDLQDLCAAAGRMQFDRASCEAVVQECRAQEPGPQIDCSLANFDFGAGCSATVGDYLACVEDWNQNLPCSMIEDFSFFGPDVREACLPLLEKCPHFIPEYGDPRRFVPACNPETSPVRVDEDDDVIGLDQCRPVPARMVTLGDSIATCYILQWTGGACGPTLISEYLREQYAPGLVYEDHSVNGAVTADGAAQAAEVAPGPGHIFVWVYLGGNDLLGCNPFSGNTEQIVACIEREIGEIRAEWEPIFAYFSDRTLFPDGATFLLNTQYGVRDECEAPGELQSGTSPELVAKHKEYNQRVFTEFALSRTDTIVVDQYPDWNGHGGNANNARCPHCYRDDNTPWLFDDGIHPNEIGHTHIADKWKVALDQMFAGCAQPSP